MMEIVAKRIIIEQTENNIVKKETIYRVKSGETVEELMKRVDVDGKTPWHFDEAEVVLKLVKEIS